MPRIRTIKPEFWDSPGTARASLRARLFFIALWGWADDWGIGTANGKQLIGYAFPNDDDVTAADFPRLAAEVADCFDVAWYEVDGRPYFAIPSWDSHQKNERRAAKRNPSPDQGIPLFTETSGFSARSDGKTPLGTGEQGNRGTGEQSLSSEVAAATPRPDVDHVLDLLDEELRRNGVTKLPARSKKNIDAARLLIDRDGRSLEQIESAIRWCQSDEFWRSNVLSMSKLRDKYEQLQQAAKRSTRSARPTRGEENLAFVARMEAQQRLEIE